MTSTRATEIRLSLLHVEGQALRRIRASRHTPQATGEDDDSDAEHRHVSQLPATSVSQRVGERRHGAGARSHANDDDADWLEAGGLEAIEHEVAGNAQVLLGALVIDVEHDHNTPDTARRLARIFVRGAFAGRYQRPRGVTTRNA